MALDTADEATAPITGAATLQGISDSFRLDADDDGDSVGLAFVRHPAGVRVVKPEDISGLCHKGLPFTMERLLRCSLNLHRELVVVQRMPARIGMWLSDLPGLDAGNQHAT